MRFVKSSSITNISITLVLLILPLIYFIEAVKGDLLLTPGDNWSYGLPMRALLGQTLAQGYWPLWNRHTFGGMPLLAAIQPGALYPPNWLFAILPLGVAMNAVVIITYHVALIGSYLYARSIRVGRAGALITAIAFTFGGFMIAHLENLNFIAAAAWLPGLLLAIEKLYQAASWRASWRWVTVGAILMALSCFAGLPQATWHMALVCAAYFLFSLWLRRESGQGKGFRRRFAFSTGAMVLCGALLSAIQLLPARELQQQGDRAAIPYETFAAFSLPPRFLLSIVFPYFFGGGSAPLYQPGGREHWWLIEWAFPYVGILGLLLLVVALSAAPRRLVWFWAFVAVAALCLSFGDFLPFGLNHQLYRIPIHNLFRGSYRHTLEFTFAAAVLAGLGMDKLGMEEGSWRRTLIRSSIVFAVIVVGVAITYRFWAHRLDSPIRPRAGDQSLANPEALVPLIFAALSLCALWLYARRRSAWAAASLIAILMFDLAFFGWFSGWRLMSYDALKPLADPPAVQEIKRREVDLNSFRVADQGAWPFSQHYEDLNHANLAILRGLQSVSGYDPMRPSRPAALAGAADIFGMFGDPNSLDSSDQGLDLLNVKYLLYEHSSLAKEGPKPVVTEEGIRFAGFMTMRALKPGVHLKLEADDFAATELALVSTMANSTHLEDGAAVAAIKLYTKDGRVIEREVQAGRDTSEWAYDRADVRPQVKHRRAKVTESRADASDQGKFEAHSYFSRFVFERSEIRQVQLSYLRPAQKDAELVIMRAALADVETGKAIPLDCRTLPPERWRLIANFGAVDLYENLRTRPRAWFVNRLVVKPSAEVLRTIKAGKSPDGQIFDPSDVALLETEDFGGRPVDLPPVGPATGAEAQVERYEPQRIELKTRNPQPGFLVLSEVYYRGWDAWVDGVKTPVYRANYALRGIAVPPGEHRIEFVFRAPSFRTGAVYSGVGVLVLLAGAIVCRHLLCRVDSRRRKMDDRPSQNNTN